MGAFKDLSGKRFGRLLVLNVSQRKQGVHILWVCRCDCGKRTTKTAHGLLHGTTRSCGCLYKESRGKAQLKHGGAAGSKPRPEYAVWIAAKMRCFNQKDPAYHNYGGRGITVCDEWKNDFGRFIADMGPCPPKMTLERIDNDGNYEPRNCRWASRAAQGLNRRNNTFYTFNGVTKTRKEWIAELQIPDPTFCYWIRKGMTFEQIYEKVMARKRNSWPS